MYAPTSRLICHFPTLVVDYTAINANLSRHIVTRVTRAFRRLWHMIPKEDRGAILSYWRSLRQGNFTIEVPECWARQRHAIGMINQRGALMRLHGPSIALLSDDALLGLIAHEMGHVLYYALGLDDDSEAMEVLDEWALDAEIEWRWGIDIDPLCIEEKQIPSLKEDLYA